VVFPDFELLVHFAEIAGVFVGFGALIASRSAHVSDVHDVVLSSPVARSLSCVLSQRS
jgi:urea transporter